MLDSLGQSNNPSTFGTRDPDSGSLHTDADRRKPLEQQARAEKGNQQRSLASIKHVLMRTNGRRRPGTDLIAVLSGSIQITEHYKPRSIRSFV